MTHSSLWTGIILGGRQFPTDWYIWPPYAQKRILLRRSIFHFIPILYRLWGSIQYYSKWRSAKNKPTAYNPKKNPLTSTCSVTLCPVVAKRTHASTISYQPLICPWTVLPTSHKAMMWQEQRPTPAVITMGPFDGASPTTRSSSPACTEQTRAAQHVALRLFHTFWYVRGLVMVIMILEEIHDRNSKAMWPYRFKARQCAYWNNHWTQMHLHVFYYSNVICIAI